MRKRKFTKALACTLALALAFQPCSAIPFNSMAVVEAAEEDGYEFAAGRFVKYENDTLTFKAVDEGITFAQVFYRVFDTEEEAQAMTGIDGLGSNDMTDTDGDGTWEVSKTEAGLEGKYIGFFCNTIINGAGTPMGITVYQIPGGSQDDNDGQQPTTSGNNPGEGNNNDNDNDQNGVNITSIDYYDETNGRNQSFKTADGCFSFCFPLMNGEAIAEDGFDQLKSAYIIQFKDGEEWKNIATELTEGTDYKFDYWKWGEGTDWAGGSWGFMYYLKEDTTIRFQSVADENIVLDYILDYEEPAEPTNITSIVLDYENGQVDADGTGTVLLDFAKVLFNDGDVAYADAESLIQWTAKKESANAFAPLDQVFTYGTNMFWDSGSGSGAWVLQGIKEPITVRVSLVADPAIYDDVLVYVDTTVDEKGDEYDFSDTENNALYDYADPGTVKEGYDLIWADEFNGNYGEGANVDGETGLNLDNWTPQDGDGTVYGNPGWGNAELQAYTGRVENVGVNEDINNDGNNDGVLRITAAYEDTPYVYGAESAKDYTSARLHSTKVNEELFSTTYGYVEARISLPMTTGAWPAFWMLPQSGEVYGGWPVSGEIDIMESTGTNTNEACGTLHRGTPGQVYSGSGDVELDSNINYFHTYAVDWEPGKITWYYDGKKIHEETNWESAISGAPSSLAYDAPFDAPFYLLLNLAIDSGRFGGAANAASFQDDINMYVDYVRVYQREEGYADSVVREATNAGDDWEDYEGINQIGTITSDSLVDSQGQLHGMETSGTVDKSKWYLACTEGGAGTIAPYVDENGKEWAKVSVTTAGGQDYSAQLIGHYDAKAGYVYKISFDAYAEGDMVDKLVSVTSTEWNTWGKYGRKQFTLTAEPTNQVYYMAQTDDFKNCRIEFNLGAVGTGNVYISNAKVEIVDPAALGTEESGRAPLANGDVIYNGNFSQGNNRLGYWTKGENTEVVVPRYTVEDLTGNDVSVVDVASTLNNFEADAKANGGVKYYERRAQISAEAGTNPSIYQAGIALEADTYALNFEMYSEADTTVTASIYTADAESNLVTKVLESDVVNYAATAGVKNYTWKFTTPSALQNAAVVFTFGDGASVQLDDVSMLGATQAEEIDETPVDADSTWGANGGGSGGVGEHTVANGVHTVTGATSGGEWYSPQITSSTFTTAAGTTYKISAKLKLENAANSVLSYMVQEQNGSWTVIKDLEDIDLSTLEQDEEGFYIYETTFVCDKAVSNVALNWGLGKSGANNSTFIFKDVAMTVVTSSEGEDEGGESMGDTPAEFVNITYVLGDDAVNADQNPTFATKGEGTVNLYAPTREGYNFLGWTTSEDSQDYITEISTTADITVYAQWEVRVDAAMPTIKKQPVAAEVEQGEALTLKVKASVTDNGTLSYQWYVGDRASGKDGVAINGATTNAYIVPTANVGTKYYYCAVTNTNNVDEINGDKVVTVNSDVVAVNVVEKEEVVTPPGGDGNEDGNTSGGNGNQGGTTTPGGNGNQSGTTTPGGNGNQGGTTQVKPHVHTWSEVKVITDATTTTTGVKGQVCTGCNEINPDTKVVMPKYTVTLNAKSAPLQVKKSTKAIKATVVEGDKVVKWESNNKKVATVSKKGVIKAKKKGTAKITVTTEKGAKATVTIKVQTKKVKTTKVAVTNVKNKKLTLNKKDKFTLETKVTPVTSPDKVTYSTSKKKVATVSKKGVITAKKKGTAKITVKSGSKKVVIKVTVK